MTASPAAAGRRPSATVALATAVSLALHGILWTLWQTREREPEQETPPLLIEATLVSPPQPTEPQPPAPPQPSEPKPAPPQPKPPEKPKPVPKPKPKPAPKPEPVARPEPAPEPTAAEPAPTASTAPAGPAAPSAAVAAVRPPTPAIFNTASLHNPPTSYPSLAQQRGWEGKVLLRVRVLANGTAGQITVQQSCGHELLDESAMEQVKHWHFIPATRDGRPVDSSVVVPIEFKLNKR